MARTITSPGVQITEKDLSLRVDTATGTNVLVTGFAAQGPTVDPLLVTTTAELESIYGSPTTPAERYFYHSCKEVLNSPATLTTMRLPYGSGSGSDFSELYSALLFPMASGAVSQALSATTSWTVGAPIHITLNQSEYNDIVQNNFTWNSTSVGSTLLSGIIVTNTGSASAVLGASVVINAGFVVLNDLQTASNNIGEGYYVAFADNSNVYGTSANFDAVTSLQSLTGANSFAPVSVNRLDFALSATETDSARGIDSISEQLERVGFTGFENEDYQDYLSFGVYRTRRSNSEGNILAVSSLEKYVGSLDYSRKEISQSGGVLRNSFLEDKINEGSPTIKVLINPAISKNYVWNTTPSTIPTTNVRVLSGAKSVFPLGVYTPTDEDASRKVIGNVVSKLDKALRLVESPENTVVDVVVDAGLSTVYALTEAAGEDVFDDTVSIESSTITTGSDISNNWKAVANTFINFAENTRKDCMAIVDPLRNVFINGKDTKVADVDGNTFTQSIYNPLKVLVTGNDSSYAATYGNWVKVRDTFSDRFAWVPFSGYAAAVFARTDRNTYPWFAPAGLNRGGFSAVDIAFNPNQKQRDRLYDLAVNPVVLFSGDGFTVFGQKTLQIKPSAFDRINVRRLFLTLERAVQKTLKYFVFEPNTDFTRTRVKNTITPIFELAKSTEGLYSYIIVCDERNNLPVVIDNNEMVVDLYLQSVRSAEYILCNFVATRTSQNFQELI